jgi:soluble lytic murein transglycosylase-like protein
MAAGENGAHGPPVLLAAYNAGVGRVCRAGGVPPIAETRGYVRRALRLMRRLRPLAFAAPEAASPHDVEIARPTR